MSEGMHGEADGIRQAAAAWLVRLQDEKSGVDDWLAFDAWLEASPEHKAAYDQTVRVSEAIEEMALELKGRMDATLAPVHFAPRSSRPSGLTRWGLGAAVAAAAVALAVMPFAGQILTPSEVYETARAPRTVVLPDGTKVYMNVGSRLSVRMTGNQRQVAMNDAEAVFDVAKDPKRPFLITAGDRLVRVVGTEFDVSHRGDDLAVTVRRGVVEVRPHDGGDAVRLLPGQRLDHSEGEATRISTVDPEDAFAWRRGRLVYRGAPLSTVVAELNRHFDGQLQLADTKAAQQRFTGVLVLDNENAVVQRLALAAPITAAPSATGYVLRSKGVSEP
jgi:transmembrane sensor